MLGSDKTRPGQMDSWSSLIASGNSLVRTHLFVVKLMEHGERPNCAHTQPHIYPSALNSSTPHRLDCPFYETKQYQNVCHQSETQKEANLTCLVQTYINLLFLIIISVHI